MPRLATTRGGSGKPLVLIHGLGSSRSIWDGTRAPLERRYDVLAMDLPGFGGQPWFDDLDTPSTMSSLADAVEAEFDYYGMKRPRIVGHSMGGWIALELARRGRARGVVAISPVGASTRREGRVFSVVMRSTHRMAQLARPVAGHIFGFGPVRSLGLRGTAGHPGDVRPEDAAMAVRHMAGATAFSRMIGDVAGHGGLMETNREPFGTIDCPVAILWGSKDRVLSPKGGPRLAEAIPDAELHELPGYGHTPMLDQPERAAELILQHA